MKIQSITLALLSALALASCSSISTEIGTNEMADNSFPVEGEAVEEGDVPLLQDAEQLGAVPEEEA